MKIIAYGSLMNQTSLEKTLRRPANLCKIIVPEFGRVFNAPFGLYAYLNLQKMPGQMEAAIFEMAQSELRKFDVREAGAELVEIIPEYFTFIWPKDYCLNLPVLQEYIDICLEGAASLDISFWLNTRKPLQITAAPGEYKG